MAKQASKTGSRRPIARAEALAIHAEAVHSEPGAFFWLMGPSVTENVREGDVAIVNVRGPLEQFADCWGENYESIVARVRDAMTGEDVKRANAADAQRAEWRGEEPPEPRPEDPPSCVVMRISSPGGVVAGLNETVRKLRAISARHGIPIVAYVDEMAASAAYALACACEGIYLPASGVVGSIGVISHMWSMARANDEDGVDVEVIASGAFKADGNENLPIEDAAIARERARVMKLARQFWTLAAKARGLSVAQVAAFEAGIFLGSDGVKSGLADDVMGWEEFLEEISLAHSGTDVPRSTAQGGTPTAKETSMLRLQALIAQTKKDIAEATGKAKADLQAKLSRLTASLADLKAYKKTKYVKEEETSEEDGDEEESDADGEDAEDEDSEDDEPPKDDAKKEKKCKSDEDADAEDAEDDAESEDDDPDKDAESGAEDDEAMLSAMIAGAKGKRRAQLRGKLAALIADAKAGREASAAVRKLTAERARDKRNAMIAAKLAKGFIRPSEATWLRTQPAATVESFLETRKRPLLRTEETQDIPKDTGRPDSAAHISDAEFAMIQQAYLASGKTVPIEKLVEDFKRGAHRPNGVAGPKGAS